MNKLDNISAQFRVFSMELLAGDPDFVVTQVWSFPSFAISVHLLIYMFQSENDCRFTFDFREVYWNSRLHTEHERLIAKFSKDDLVADVFAGVGPFAIPAAKKGCAVLANDLNPSSYKYLTLNITENKVRASIDGRASLAGLHWTG